MLTRAERLEIFTFYAREKDCLACSAGLVLKGPSDGVKETK